MKCIRNKTTNEIKRVSNEEAAEKVATELWTYCTKDAWKRQVRDAK